MRTLAIFGVALLSAAAFLGGTMTVGCGSDSAVNTAKGGSKNKGGTKNVKGGDATEDTTTDENPDETGNEDEAGGSKVTQTKTGGSKNGTGGSTKQATTDEAGGAGTSVTPSNGDSIALSGGLYTASDFSGYLWTAKDKPTDDGAVGSTITPPCGDSPECFTDKACVTGTVAKIPLLAATSKPDYSGVWGIEIGWNLYADDTGTLGQDVSAKKSVTVGLGGPTIPTSLRVQVEVPDEADATKSTIYCATLTRDADGNGTIDLANLKTECWTKGGTAFDPATMKPKNVAVQAVAKESAEQPFDFCITKLSLD